MAGNGGRWWWQVVVVGGGGRWWRQVVVAGGGSRWRWQVTHQYSSKRNLLITLFVLCNCRIGNI